MNDAERYQALKNLPVELRMYRKSSRKFNKETRMWEPRIRWTIARGGGCGYISTGEDLDDVLERALEKLDEGR